MKNNSAGIIGVVIVSLVIIGIAVYSTGNKSSTENSKSSLITNTEISSPSKQTAPDFSLEKLGGGTITLAEYKGRKPVVLDFWATWCPNCRRDMPHLSALYDKYKDQVEVIGIDLQENKSLVQKTVTDWKITFPIALDPNGSASSAYGVRYTNFHVLIDKDGNVVRSIPGDITEADIQSLIN